MTTTISAAKDNGGGDDGDDDGEDESMTFFRAGETWNIRNRNHIRYRTSSGWAGPAKGPAGGNLIPRLLPGDE